MKTLILFLALVVTLALGTCSTSTGPDEATETEVPGQASHPACEPNGALEPHPADQESTTGKPVRLRIDSIGVDARVEHVGLNDAGRMDTPQEWDNVAWFELGPVPGDRGNAIIAGHFDSDTGPAVFYDLDELEPGDEVWVITEDDRELAFRVVEVTLTHVDEIDARKVFGETRERNLNLITCGGEWDRTIEMYEHRLIVYSTLVSE